MMSQLSIPHRIQRILSSRYMLGLCLAIFTNQSFAQEAKQLTPEAVQFFETKIRPVLVEQCYSCHSNGGQAVRGGLMVDSREGLRGGGESGPAVVAEDLDESLLWNAINFVDFQMPPRQKLPDSVIQDFKTWILMGAPDPRTGDVEVVQTRVTPEAIEAGREHWAFLPPQKSQVPTVSNSDWAQNDIDRFVANGHEEAGLQPVADADAYTVLRRLTFDLIGLPPQPTDITRFVNQWNKNPSQAVAAEVDRLLALPQFGERWGRHWLDVARYAESTGKEVDVTFPQAWRYRDFVIDSFNQDKPYDHFVRQQIAGDLLPVDNDDQWAENLIATGFLALGPKTIVERNPRQFQADLVDEQIDVTTRVVLGVSVACARCHDHKFDPIPQSDYYALAGIFQSTETYFGGASNQRVRQGSNLLILPVEDEAASIEPIDDSEFAAIKRELAEKQTELATAEREQRMLLRNAGNNSQQDAQRIRAKVVLLERQATQLQQRLNQYDENGSPLTLCMGTQDANNVVNARVLVRGEINQPAQEVERGFVQVIGGHKPELPENASGRLELANWMTDRDNPLTARVMVNRIWLHMIGQPLVAETDNFGRSGQPPVQQQLLDYLAVRFMDSGWSVKTLIKEIANSRTYRISTSHDQQLLTLDPENHWLARANPKRLEAEVIRDAMLMASGEIDLDRPIGSEISQMGATVLGPDGVPAFQQFGFRDRPTPLTEIAESYRSVYLPISRSAVPRSLEVFDFAEPTMVIGIREESNTATQSLYLLNNSFVIEQSERFAERILDESDSTQQAVRRAFVLTYGRLPTVEEYKAAMEFLRDANIEFTRGRQSETDERSMQGNRTRRAFQRGGFAQDDRSSQADRFRGRPAVREMIERFQQQRSGESTASSASLSPMAQLCQALFASAEFRYLD